MRSALLCASSAEKIFLFAAPKRLRAFRSCFFTGGVVEGNGSCRACFLRKQPRGGNPLSLLTTFAASAPKGTPLRYAGNLSATTKSRPLGEGGIAVGDDGRGIPGKYTLQFNQKLSRHAKSSPFGGAGTPSGVTERVSACRRQTQKQPDRAVWLLLCL